MSAEDKQIQRWLVHCHETVFQAESTGLVLLCMCEFLCKLFYMEAFQKPESEPRVVTLREHPPLGGRIDRAGHYLMPWLERAFVDD